MRGFTALSERLPPAEVATHLNRFYRVAANAVFDQDGTLDKLIGDAVMAFFGHPIHYMDHPRRAIEAARVILHGVAAVGGDEPLMVGAGVACGEAYVGNVGEGEVQDFTVLGDVVNVAARLQALAAPGELLVTEEAYAAVRDLYPDAPQRELEVKGKSQPVPARVLNVWKSSTPAPSA